MVRRKQVEKAPREWFLMCPLSSRQWKNKKNILLKMVSAMAGAIFLCGSVELHGSHAAKPFLVTLGVVEKDVILNSCDQPSVIGKLSQIVHLGFQDSPESLHRPVVNASSNSGHALYHFCSIQLCSEYLTCWNPRSLWNSGCASGWFLTASSKVSNTSLLLLPAPIL